jgi:short-chain fatty acids transporter
MLQRIASALTRWSTRWVPDSWVIAVILTVVAAVAAVLATGQTPLAVVGFWGDGLWELLAFGMQMAIVIVSGYILAETPVFRRGLEKLATLATGPRSAVALMALTSLLLAWVNWGLSLIGSGVFAKTLARRVPQADFRLLVASAYLGLGCLWHAGLSASAPLLVATEGHFLVKQVGVIPVTQTIFHPFNLLLSLAVIVVMTTVAVVAHPPAAESDTLTDPEPPSHALPARPAHTPAERLEQSPVINWVIGGAGLLWLVQYLAAKGAAGINLNVVNLFFLSLGVLLHGTPQRFLKAAEEAGHHVWGIVVQFPLYGGIFGIIKYSGLQDIASVWFAGATTPALYPLFVTWYSGVLNYLIPSGGAKWAVEAPYVLQAAQTMGASVPATVLAYAWGDMLTDIIQPFWAIPLLGLAKLQFRDIMGYALLFFAIYALLVTAAFAAAPWFF